MLSSFQLDNTNRSSSYVAAYSTPSNLPPSDANTVMRLALNEGAGTSVADSSASAFTGALSAATMWVP